MTQPAGRAAVEIVGDASGFGDNLEREAKESFREVERSAEISSRKITRSVDAAGRDIERTFNTIAADGKVTTTVIEKAFGDANQEIRRTMRFTATDVAASTELIERVAAEAADSTADDFERAGERIERAFAEARRSAIADTVGIAAAADRAADTIDNKFTKRTNRGFAQTLEAILPIGRAVQRIVTRFAGLSFIITTIASVAIPVIIALSAALADLLGLLVALPAGIAVLTAVITPLVIAFQGFGDAVEAIVEGDPEKIAEAMERLAPAARGVVREFAALLPQFRELGDLVQQAFFEQLSGSLTELADAALPTLSSGLRSVAAALGEATARFGDLLGRPENVEILGRVFDTTARIVETLADSALDFGDALLSTFDAGLPAVERLVDGMASLLDSFGRFLQEAAASGQLEEFFSDALDTMRELGDLTSATGDLLATLFQGTDDAGRGFLATLTDIIESLDEFFESEEGQQQLEQFRITVTLVGEALQLLFNILTGVAGAFNSVQVEINKTKDDFDAAAAGIDRFWSDLTATVSAAVDEVVGFVQSIPDRTVAAIQSIPDRVAAAIDAAVDLLINAVAFAIASVVVLFTDGVNQSVGALLALRDRVTEIFNEVVQSVEEAINRATDFVGRFPGRVEEFFDQAREGAEGRLDQLVAFARSIPGRITDALSGLGSRLFNAGVNIINSLIDGARSRFQQLRDAIANAASIIRDHLPFSPAKVGPLSGDGNPERAGATIAQMIADGLASQLPLIARTASQAAGAVRSPLSDAGAVPLTADTAAPGVAPLLPAVAAQQTSGEVIVVRIGDEDIEAFIERVVVDRLDVETRSLMAGSRGVGV